MSVGGFNPGEGGAVRGAAERQRLAGIDQQKAQANAVANQQRPPEDQIVDDPAVISKDTFVTHGNLDGVGNNHEVLEGLYGVYDQDGEAGLSDDEFYPLASDVMVIHDLYQSELGRPADAEGMIGWAKAMQAFRTENPDASDLDVKAFLTEQIQASDEYMAAHPAPEAPEAPAEAPSGGAAPVPSYQGGGASQPVASYSGGYTAPAQPVGGGAPPEAPTEAGDPLAGTQPVPSYSGYGADYDPADPLVGAPPVPSYGEGHPYYTEPEPAPPASSYGNYGADYDTPLPPVSSYTY